MSSMKGKLEFRLSNWGFHPNLCYFVITWLWYDWFICTTT